MWIWNKKSFFFNWSNFMKKNLSETICPSLMKNIIVVRLERSWTLDQTWSCGLKAPNYTTEWLNWTELTQWTWVWANSRRQWQTGKPGILQSMGLQRVRHDLAIEQHKLTACLGKVYCLELSQVPLFLRSWTLWWTQSIRMEEGM